MLRAKYLARQGDRDDTFHSVVLVSVCDIKNIKLKLANEGLMLQSEGDMLNAPWNIAADFNVDMSFSPREIATMLADYEAEHKTNMDIDLIAQEIYSYTSGYPFLVSRICKCIGEEIEPQNWTVQGVQDAVKKILAEKSVLFDDISKNLENNQEIYNFMYQLLMAGRRMMFNLSVPAIDWFHMFGYVEIGNKGVKALGQGYAVVANKIFELFLSDYFASKDANAGQADT
jgi:hypothetical protein